MFITRWQKKFFDDFNNFQANLYPHCSFLHVQVNIANVPRRKEKPAGYSNVLPSAEKIAVSLKVYTLEKSRRYKNYR